jgi:hypothetical protein
MRTAADADAGLREEAVRRHLDNARQLHAADLASPAAAASMPDSQYARAGRVAGLRQVHLRPSNHGSSVSARRL